MTDRCYYVKHTHTHTCSVFLLLSITLFSHTLCPVGIAVCPLQHNSQGPPVAKDASGILFLSLVEGSDTTDAQRRRESTMLRLTAETPLPLYIFKTNPPLNI